MTSLSLFIPIIVTVITGSVAISVMASNIWINGQRERINRRRDVYSKALTAITQYEEFAYVVRRRRHDKPEEERIRISTEFRAVQESISYFSAWLNSESKEVSEAYEVLVSKVREIVGSEVHKAWLEPPVITDSDMNMPDFGFGALKPYKNQYLSVVAEELSSIPGWIRRLN